MKLTKSQKAKLERTREDFLAVVEYTEYFYDLADIVRMVFIERKTLEQITKEYDENLEFAKISQMELNEAWRGEY